jgi:predicted O-methyltransferase YrrM
MHSPFVFDFILRVLNNKNHYQASAAIEKLRSEVRRDKTMLDIEDLGAGSRNKKTPASRTVKQLARTALKSPKYAQVLYRLVKHYQPATIIELGTSLGLTTAYLSEANPEARIWTIEGSRSVHLKAMEHFKKLGLKNIKALHGAFDEWLPNLLDSVPVIDLAYIDGNHRYEPTIQYFHQLLAKRTDHTILVFDDIHWSAEMEQAWEEIKSHPEVQYTIDIFFLGFVFFRSEFKVKQDFVIRY